MTCLCAAALVAAACHQTPAVEVADPQTTGSLAAGAGQREQFGDFLTSLLRDNVPDQYEDDRKWGQTKEVFDGLKIHRDGFRIKTKRRKKEVNHGSWQKYRFSLLQPEKHLSVQVKNVQPTSDGKVQFEAIVQCKMKAFGRWSEWRWGIQAFSLSIEAIAQIQLQLTGRLGVTFDPSRFPPDVMLQPEVLDTELAMSSFRVQKISKAKGPLARELGRTLEHVLREKLEEKQGKIAGRINRQIERHQDDLRFSMHDILTSKWNEICDELGETADRP